ncbi:MAG TPA: SBBP repeat-containing protein [Candidatus Binatia bacterium]|nr:SBBP repeat-containing protein [Candidatus Binatia bacterium]
MKTALSTIGLITAAALLLALAGTYGRDQRHDSAGGTNSGRANATERAKALETYGRFPMSFTENQGQTDDRVQFVSRGAGYILFLTRDGAVMKLKNASASSSAPASASHGPNQIAPKSTSLMPYVGNRLGGFSGNHTEDAAPAVLSLKVLGANGAAEISGVDRLPNTSNYFIGSDPTKWRTNVENFERVRYAGIYPGVDMIYYGSQGQLEYDFVVAPGADPGRIALQLGGGAAGQQPLAPEIDSTGDLVAHLEGGNVQFHQPVVYQTVAGRRQNVDARYTVRANGEVGFELGSYDRSRELVIDPTVAYSTYLGGSNIDVGYGAAVDCCGSSFIVGGTFSTDFPVTSGDVQGANAGGEDIFVTKFVANASSEEYSTYIGGSGNDVATDIHLDNLGDMTVTGYTLSQDFPLVNWIQGTFGGGTVTGDAFVFQIASHGTALVYSTYLGGDSDDQGYSLAIDASNNVYVVGYTSSTNFPVTQDSLSTTCPATAAGACSTGFVTKISSSGSEMSYSTYLGGSNGLGDSAYGVTTDANGDAYVVGITGSPNFPTTSGAYKTSCGSDSKCNGTYDGFVSELNPSGNGFVFSSFLGGSAYDYSAGIALDTTGIYVSGNTTSTDFPTTKGAAQTTFGGMSSGCVPNNATTCGDVTITKLKTNGSALIYSTYLGGSQDENPGLSMAVDPGGSVYVTGQTASLNFPSVNALLPTYNGGPTDGFLTKLNPAGSAWVYSTYLGGDGPDNGSRVALDIFTAAYVTGTTGSLNFPTTGGVFQLHCNSCGVGMSDTFVTKVATNAQLTLTMTAPATIVTGSALAYTITSGNTGPDAASAVVLTDTIPTGTTFKSLTVNSGTTCKTPAAGGTGTVTCSNGLQNSGANIKITLNVNVTAAAGSVITNTSTVTAANQSNNTNPSVTDTTNVTSAAFRRRHLIYRANPGSE